MNKKNLLLKIFRNNETIALANSIFITSFAIENIGKNFWLASLLALFSKFLTPKLIRYYVGNVLALASAVWVFREYKSFLNIEAGISLLVLLQACRFIAAKKKEEYLTHSNILLFIITGQVLFNQSFISLMASLTSIALIIYSYAFYENPNLSIKKIFKKRFKKSFTPFLITLPITAAFFIFFPRIPINFKPSGSTISSSGFSPDNNPSKVSEINLSNKPAFKVRFEENAHVPIEHLYWTGATLYYNDGFNWRAEPNLIIKEGKGKKEGLKAYKYTIFSELLSNEYLFTLDNALSSPQIYQPYRKISPKTFKLNRSLTSKISYQGESVINEFHVPIDPQERMHALRLPKGFRNQRLEGVISKFKSDSEIRSLSNILVYFVKNDFKYSLKPGQSKNLMEFLFNRRKGFCAHYASAFAILSRMLGIPSRVVVGYQGGKLNPYDGTYAISQRDAHAWAESYIEGRGWVRFDPVSSLAPERIRLGGQDFFEVNPDGEQIISSNELEEYRNRFWPQVTQLIDSFNNKWTQFMYSFDQEKQYQMMKKLKIGYKLFYSLSIFLPLFLLVSFITYFLLRGKLWFAKTPRHIKEYKRVLKNLEKFRIEKLPKEGPLSMLNKIESCKDIDEKTKDEFIIKINQFRALQYKEDRLI